MSSELFFPWLSSLISFTLLLWVVLIIVAGWAREDTTQVRWSAGTGFLALGAALVMVDGLPLARLVHGFGLAPSVPLLALLADEIVRRARRSAFLTPTERLTGWCFGAVAGLALYPSALGLGRFDAYALGWGCSPACWLLIALAIVLIWWNNRFGVVLVVATGAWQAEALESTNHWDYLVDPLFFLISLVVLSVVGLRRLMRGPQEIGQPV